MIDVNLKKITVTYNVHIKLIFLGTHYHPTMRDA